MRVQLALNVKDLDEAIAYYSKMFGVEPHKIRDGYANFEVEQPPLKLVLFERPDAEQQLNHIGVEMFKHSDIDRIAERFSETEILESVQKSTVCCHADQDKVWTKESQGLRWEWYVINDDQPDRKEDASSCCAGLVQEAL
ncbi:MAG: glyoxalase/bleomycin resistance/extradiol dioxygenase family protein [Alphaproteobacteria bacterium]|nr:glyoxalase/bleomycin resistance/extradiol dioxygenase family protein [Alphaproteobacteria bacterium]